MSYIRSSNNNFAIHINHKEMLFVKNKILSEVQTYIKNKNDMLIEVECPTKIRGYTCFRFATKFKDNLVLEDDIKEFNDCLRMAEELTCGIKDYIDEEPILQEKTTGKIFGNSHEENIKIAKKVKKIYTNELANPEVGETYAIVRTREYEVGENPYHIAYVLFKDGTTNITLEANASGTLEYPVFDMYGTEEDDKLFTFHEREIATYSPATTIVLNSRGITPKLTLTKMATKSKTLNRSIKK